MVIQDIEELRARLRTAVAVGKIARATGLSYSWLMKFRHGKIVNPTLRSVTALREFFDAPADSPEPPGGKEAA